MRILFTLLLAIIINVSNVVGQSVTKPAKTDSSQLIVWLQPGVNPSDMFGFLREQYLDEAIHWERLGFDLYLLKVGEKHQADVKSHLESLSEVRNVGINRQAVLRNTLPNDPEYEKQWHHNMLGSELAWDITTGGITAGGYKIVIAILDSGFERDHEDIAPNLWINTGEIPSDGLDNDLNGHIDDYNGIFTKIDNGEIPVESHGHSVIGYIAGKGNNSLGITGLSWDASMMLIGSTKIIQESDMIKAFDYVYQWRKKFNDTNGAEGAYIPAMNLSLGFPNVKPDELPWMCPLVEKLGEEGVLVVAAAPNAGIDIEIDGDLPCLCTSSNIICVTSTTREDDLVSNAGFSKNYVHLSAPGFQSYTTKLVASGLYGSFSGTSAAAPMVTGAIGLLAAMPCDSMQEQLFTEPALSAMFLKEAIINGVYKINDLKGITTTGGRLCLWCEDGIGAVQALANRCGSAEGPVAVLQITPNPANELVRIDFRSPGTTVLPVRIYNILGQLIWEEAYIPETFEPKFIEINSSFWPAGVYLISAGAGAARKSSLMVIHH